MKPITAKSNGIYYTKDLWGDTDHGVGIYPKRYFLEQQELV
jgi:hypothetical protein